MDGNGLTELNWVPLKDLKNSNPVDLAEYAVANALEEEPAFKRSKVDLEETIHSSEDEVSHFSLEEKDDNILLNDNNSYLHDNVD